MPSKETSVQLPRRPYLVAGTAGLVTAASGLIAVTAVVPPPDEPQQRAVQLVAGEEEITLDLVRHGSDGPPAYLSTIGSYLPGYPLNSTGEEEADAVAKLLAPEAPFAGIYAGDNIRMPETAAPLSQLVDQPVQLLPGLDEIAGGIYNGDQAISLGGILYEVTLAAWVFGLLDVPMPGSNDLNGMEFDENFTGAVQTIYDNTVSAGGPTTDVAFSGEAAISTWTLMNAKNPDLSIFLPLFAHDLESGGSILPNTGVVVLEGSPTAGWTIVSWNGESIPAPGLLTELVVDVRSLIEAPQLALYNIQEAILGSNTAAIETAIQTGISQVATATEQFPVAVFDDIVNALGGGSSTAGADLATSSLGDLSGLVSALASDLSGLL
ncbi:MAG: histidine phosphatase family protein [Mycobacterium sp.]|nr:MAG: histidine phosphatase family protein [Mycobacterium sp.]